MKILIVEDEEPKLNHIIKYFEAMLPMSDLSTARSVRSGIIELEDDVFDLVLLDMSLPTFDVAPGETGGRPQGFGGTELMREMEMLDVLVPAVVLTGYEAFTKTGGEIGLSAMNDELREEFPEFFKGMLHFNSAYGDWQSKLTSLLTELGFFTK